jgi:hypothetical protein
MSAGRLEMYAGIHKALRALMGELVTAAGRMDPDDDHDVHATLEDIQEGLALCEKHLRIEDEIVHPALEARRPGSSARAAFEHAGHGEEYARLREAIAAVRAAPGPARHAASYRLYLALARWTADNFVHMEYEELHLGPALWEAYTDEELHGIHRRILAGNPPPVMARYLRWIVPSLNHGERVAQFAGMRAGAPREAFEGALALARAHLAPRDWDKLARALDVPLAAAA